MTDKTTSELPVTTASEEAVKQAVTLLEDLGWDCKPPGPERWGCHCDLFAMPEDYEPDSCVIDEGNRSGCVYARNIRRKTQCGYWRRVTPQSIREARGG